MLERKNKKGSLTDLVFIIGIILFFAMIILFSFKIGNEFNDHIQTDTKITAEGKAATSKLVAYYPGVVDNMFLFFSIGMVMVSLILAALVRVHPIFIPLYILGLIIIVFFSGLFSNIYQEVAATPELATEAAQLTMISNILTFLPLFTFIAGLLIMITLYKVVPIAE